MFQSPSLRGSGRFVVRVVRSPPANAGFNPLHCGAVVASGEAFAGLGVPGRVSIPFIAGQWSLPLSEARTDAHQRVFQSPSLRGSGRFPGRRPGRPNEWIVSIPFIAGQWSLRLASTPGRRPGRPVSIPFIAGQWSLLVLLSHESTPFTKVSIPFIAGQWSLHVAKGAKTSNSNLLFQSPSLRGSGRFKHFSPQG